jgi:hypothetical protein
MDPYFQDEQIILNMLKYLPTKEEVAELEKHNSIIVNDKLGEPEKFCLQVCASLVFFFFFFLY